MGAMTGENEIGLRKIIDMTRMISIVVLLIHFYYYCYGAFAQWELTHTIGDRFLANIGRSGLFKQFNGSKLVSLLFLAISLVGAKGRKNPKSNYHTCYVYIICGLLVYFISGLVLSVKGLELTQVAQLYMVLTGTGYLLILTGGVTLSRIIKSKLSNEVFNRANETFPQEERLLTNPYSINLPAVYKLKGGTRKMWINYVNPRRGLLVLGSPGSGKSWYIIENAIRQLSDKSFAQFVFDFKYPELTNLPYNLYLKNKHKYPVEPKFFCVNFTTPIHRLNPLYPDMLHDLVDAIEASKTMLLSINKTWASRQGEFFVESPINLLAAVIWFLKKFDGGKYCTLPHAIELLQLPYDKLFTVLNYEPEIETLVNPFSNAYLNDVMETVDNQLASVKIPLGRLSSPSLYYILSGNDFTLDINNPKEPKIFCLGNDPLKADALAPVISLICDRLNKIINQPGRYKCATIYDEFATIRASSVLRVIGQGRSNDIICIIALQDYSQLKQVYSREEAEAIFNMTGNIISGQVSGETAKLLSERFPKIMQDRESMSINSSDTSISRSKQLEASIPPSTISSLSSGEFVGITADNPDQPIELKAHHCRIVNDVQALASEKAAFKPLPESKEANDPKEIQRVFFEIKQHVQDIAEVVMERMLNDPAKEHLIIKK
ncbi:YWFCY domain-containing protein [Longitalea luteola]|uniref:YWFCY domain-containing protein n=1 Tax=Longitalea luteola TaxID=2812563 RepID=UPI001A96642C|nr:YWFCY domain-containing protein [Longitalea luteola]